MVEYIIEHCGQGVNILLNRKFRKHLHDVTEILTNTKIVTFENALIAIKRNTNDCHEYTIQCSQCPPICEQQLIAEYFIQNPKCRSFKVDNAFIMVR